MESKVYNDTVTCGRVVFLGGEEEEEEEEGGLFKEFQEGEGVLGRSGATNVDCRMARRVKSDWSHTKVNR